MGVEGSFNHSETSPRGSPIEEQLNQGARYFDTILENARLSRVSFTDTELSRERYSHTDERIRKLTQYEQTLNHFLSRYSVPVEVHKIGENVFRISAEKQHMVVDQLPEGFVYIGGSARAVLERVLHTDPDASPRDIDIAHDVIEVSEPIKQELSQTYMEEDFSHGHGVMPLGERYFSTRDFTRNELFYDGKDIYCTKDCLLDTVRSIVRLSEFEKSSGVNSKLLAKALRFISLDGKQTLDDTTTTQLLETNIAPFHIALHLDRAQAAGTVTAQRYLERLIAYGQLPTEIDSVEKLIRWVDDRLENPFMYRSRLKEDEDDIVDAIAMEYQNVPTQVSPRKYGKHI